MFVILERIIQYVPLKISWFMGDQYGNHRNRTKIHGRQSAVRERAVSLPGWKSSDNPQWFD